MAAISGVVTAIMGDPKVQRQNQINRNLFLDQYQAPTARNVTSSTLGTFADINAQGNLRTSLLSPYPRATTPYLDWPYRFNVPGVQTSQFGGGGPITVNVSALDSADLSSYLKRNSSAVVDSVAHGLTFGHTALTAQIKAAAGQA